MTKKSNSAEDDISKVLQDPYKIRDIIQEGINAAMLRHKKLGNRICGWQNGKIVWIEPKDIPDYSNEKEAKRNG